MLHNRPPRPGVTGPVLDAVETWTRVGLGVVAFTARQSDRHLVGSAQLPESGDDSPTLPTVLPGALFGLALAGQSALFDVLANTEARLAALVGLLTRRGPAGWASRRLQGALEPWDQRWRTEQQAHAEAAAEFLASIGPGTLDELLGRIDVERVVDRVPVDYVVDRLDVNSIVAEIANELRYSDLVRESTNAILREGTGALAATTAEVVRGQVGAVTRFTSLPFRGRQQAAQQIPSAEQREPAVPEPAQASPGGPPQGAASSGAAGTVGADRSGAAIPPQPTPAAQAPGQSGEAQAPYAPQDQPDPVETEAAAENEQPAPHPVRLAAELADRRAQRNKPRRQPGSAAPASPPESTRR